MPAKLGPGRAASFTFADPKADTAGATERPAERFHAAHVNEPTFRGAYAGRAPVTACTADDTE